MCETSVGKRLDIALIPGVVKVIILQLRGQRATLNYPLSVLQLLVKKKATIFLK